MLYDIDITEELLKKDIKPSYQRLKILGYLANNKNHPTVEQIFNELSAEIPTLSKTTVYNALNLFIQAGLVKPLNIEDHETRYDFDISDHGHFKCIECGTIYDFPIKIHIENEFKSCFEILEKNVYYKGYCPQCLGK